MMKRAIAILMAIMLCMTFIACSNQPVTQPTMESGETVMSELVSATSGNEDDSEDGGDFLNLVSDIDVTEKALAVEKLIYAFEANKGTISDLSFVDGYVEGKVDNCTVKAYIYTRRDGVLDINVRATKYLPVGVLSTVTLLICPTSIDCFIFTCPSFGSLIDLPTIRMLLP